MVVALVVKLVVRRKEPPITGGSLLLFQSIQDGIIQSRVNCFDRVHKLIQHRPNLVLLHPVNHPCKLRISVDVYGFWIRGIGITRWLHR